MVADPQIYHTLGIIGSILTGAGLIAKPIYKIINNHLRHAEQNIIKNAESNTKAIVTAVQTSSVAIVAAINSKKS